MRKNTFLFYVSAILLGFNIAANGDNYWYVTPTGSVANTGLSWDNAFSNVQDAVDVCTNDGDIVYLRYGTYSNASQVVISNAPDVTIYGGCYGSGVSSNDYSGTNSTLTKTGGEMRILYGYASTSTLSGVTISGGYFLPVRTMGPECFLRIAG